MWFCNVNCKLWFYWGLSDVFKTNTLVGFNFWRWNEGVLSGMQWVWVIFETWMCFWDVIQSKGFAHAIQRWFDEIHFWGLIFMVIVLNSKLNPKSDLM
jgi:hypothetical protein